MKTAAILGILRDSIGDVEAIQRYCRDRNKPEYDEMSQDDVTGLIDNIEYALLDAIQELKSFRVPVQDRFSVEDEKADAADRLRDAQLTESRR